MPSETSSPINEIDRVVIHLPDDAMFYSHRSYLPVAIDLIDGEQQPTLLRHGDRGISYMAQYEIFSVLCSDRAQKAVDHQLLAAGKPVTPERYLGLWRTAIAESVTAAVAKAELGIQAVAVLRAPLAAMSDAKSSWTSCPFGTFARFQAAYGHLFKHCDDGTFALELDLAIAGCAQAAYYGASMMCNKFDRGSSSWHAGILIRRVGTRLHQAGLFEVAEA